MFEEIKEISNQIIRQMAIKYSKEAGMQFEDDNQPTEIKLREETIDFLQEEKNISGRYGLVRTKAEKSDGREIQIIALTQAFYKAAPELTRFITELNRCFVIETKDRKNLEIRSGRLSDKIIPCLSEYFVQGEEAFAVDLATDKIIKLKGYLEARGGKDSSGQIGIEVNLEYDISLNNLVHELVHARIPEEIPEYNVLHKQIDKFGDEIQRQVNIHNIKNPISEMDVLKEEKLQILNIFNEFDERLRNSNLL